jgi:2-polyprenyl-3-methyl-5-hydroxy-6-metoxy-1,4-benzoquinol methylase
MGVSDQRKQWERFYDGHAPFYGRNAFVANTVAEVEFLLELLALPSGSSILDVGCGTGRHAIELAGRGFAVTGVDISSGMLVEGARAAKAAGVDVEWVHSDATAFRAKRSYDAVLCLCGSALTMVDMEEDPEAHDRAILGNIREALRPDGPFVLTTLNGYRRIREVTQADVESGAFDPATMVHRLDEEWTVPGGSGRIVYQERLYTPPELCGLLRSEGFEVEHVWGATAGRWGRRALELDEIEVMVVSRRV